MIQNNYLSRDAIQMFFAFDSLQNIQDKNVMETDFPAFANSSE